MDADFFDKLKELLLLVFINKKNYYNKKLQKAGFTKKNIINLNESEFKKIPILKIEELITIPIKQRQSNIPGLHKMVFINDKYFLIFRSLDEIKKMELPLDFKRPLVVTQDTYEALEICLYFYQKKMLPLIGEVLNPAVLYATAKQYEVDSILLDCLSSDNFYKELIKLKLPLKNITLIDKSIDRKYLQLLKGLKANYIISLPEFGPIAYACKYASIRNFIYHACDNVFIEQGKNAVITNLGLIACPMIRYESNLDIFEIPPKCKCNKKSYLVT